MFEKLSFNAKTSAVLNHILFSKNEFFRLKKWIAFILLFAGFETSFAVCTQVITATSGANGSISSAGTTTVICGSNKLYTITAASCYRIADVLIDGSSVGPVAVYTFTNITTDHTISATFSIKTYTLTASAGSNGSISPSGVTVANCGSTQVYTITPATCYRVSNVLVNGVSKGAVSSYTISNIQANQTIAATFAIKAYSITASAGANGSISSAGTVNLACGGTKTYSITPSSCYNIANVLVNGSSVGAVSVYTFTNVAANHSISATFSIKTYSITASAGSNGTISSTGVTSVNCGSKKSYSITAATCYRIADVLADGISVGPVAVYSFTNIAANHTISVSFTIKTYSITASAGAGGSISSAGVTGISCNGSKTYSITASSCYNIANVTVNGLSKGAISVYTFSNVAASYTILATFSIKTYSIAASAGAGGSISSSGVTSVSCGSNKTYSITPGCYNISDVIVDGSSVGPVSVYTFTNTITNHSISATFVIKTYSLTASAGPNGSISSAGVTSINCGNNKVYTIAPATCYGIANVLVDGSSVGAVSVYTFTSVAASHTISATFVSKTYSITASAGSNGSISPAGVTSVNCGSNQTYTITPASSSYRIEGVLLDGVSIGAVTTYTISNVRENHTISATFVLKTYSITAIAGTGGTISSTGVTSVNSSSNKTYSITPGSCYNIADVTVDGSSLGVVSVYTFTNVIANHTISATFVIKSYSITASAGANGTISSPGVAGISCGNNKPYTITPSTCYGIADVLVDGMSVGPVAAFTFTSVATNHTISATFVIKSYSITASAGANGTISPAGVTTVSCSGSQTYSITPASCYKISSVMVNGVSKGAISVYTFTNVTSNRTISATFALATYSIMASAGANGSISPLGTKTVSCGGSKTYSITPSSSCYNISNVLVDGSSVGAVSVYTFTNVTANHTISASFTIQTYSFSVSAGANGSISSAGSLTSANCSSKKTYSITPASCYKIEDVIVDGSSVGPVAVYSFTNVAADHSISATFSIKTLSITASAGANGSISSLGTSTVSCGGSKTYSITPSSCYNIANVKVNGVSKGAISVYTFTNVTANHVISATFSLQYYSLTASAGTGGNITSNGVSNVNCGSNKTYSITPLGCYNISDVQVDGMSVGSVAVYTFTNVVTNHSISATFVIKTYSITASAGANGSISSPGVTSVNCGSSQAYTITPEACYRILNVLVDGVSVGTVSSYTLSNITANRTISASFGLIPYTITSSADANGDISPVGSTTLTCGSDITYTITPTGCYIILDVIVDGSSVGAVSVYTFTNVTANHSIEASFSNAMCKTSSLQENESNDFSFIVYPNPSDGNNISIKINGLAEEGQEGSVLMYNLYGEYVYSGSIVYHENNNVYRIEAQKITASGIYFVELQLGEKKYKQKLLIVQQ